MKQATIYFSISIHHALNIFFVNMSNKTKQNKNKIFNNAIINYGSLDNLQKILFEKKYVTFLKKYEHLKNRKNLQSTHSLNKPTKPVYENILQNKYTLLNIHDFHNIIIFSYLYENGYIND